MNIAPYLEKHKDTLIKELSALIGLTLPQEVRCVEVMVFRNAMPRVPFRIFFLDRFKGPAKTIDSIGPLSSIGALVDSPDYLPREEAICECLDLEESSAQDACMDAVAERYDEESERLCHWFAECWQAAGGAHFPYPAFVVEEDGQFNPFDLKKGEPVRHMHEYDKVFDG